ncbi:hypothetical protein OIU84_007324 [Salix udensis]|uniref:Pentatricopeptide repeat-containing protein n=1 Tax=Salix udensis TaxID=889485 RepID=A0AAD6JSU8_9ROSI|nr:hypothetical protein OIU84_007324 [Salix udensis]
MREALAVLTDRARERQARIKRNDRREEIPDEEEKAYAQMQWNQKVDTCKMWNVEAARVVFDTVVERDANNISWNSKLSEYTQNGQARQALLLFDEMRGSDCEPLPVIASIMVSACAYLVSPSMAENSMILS